MIIRLVREQLRSGRRSLAWSGTLLIIAVGLASAAFVGASTQITTYNMADAAWTPRLDETAWVEWWSNGAPADDPLDRANDPSTNLVELPELELMIDQAHAAGGEAVAQYVIGMQVTPVAGSHGGQALYLVSRYPDVDSTTGLVDGLAPGAGEVVLGAHVAQQLGISVGDEVRFTSLGEPAVVLHDSVTVSGLSRSSAGGPLWSLAQDGYLAWDDSMNYARDLPAWIHVSAAGEPTELLTADVTWTHGSDAMSTLWPIDVYNDSEGSLWLGFEGWPTAAIAAAGLVAIAMIGATFAMARSQAQRRIQWVATARVLGAKRSTLVAASAGEAVVIGLVASAVGIALGYVAVAGVMALTRWKAPGALLPSAPTLAPLGLVLLMGLGLLLAAITAIAPAFWATRVEPAAALKPSTPFSEARVSRDVSGRWLVVIGALAVAGVIAGTVADVHNWLGIGKPLEAIGVIAVLVVAVAVVIELGRRGVKYAGQLLARIRAPWAIAVEAALSARWRSSGTAAGTVGLAAAGVVGTVAFGVYSAVFGTTDAVLDGIVRSTRDWAWQRATPSWSLVLVTLGVMSLAAVVAAAITSTARHASATDDAVQNALGLSARDARRAAGVEAAMPILVGALVGAAVGWVGAAIIAVTNVSVVADVADLWLVGAATTLISAAVTVMLAALISGATGLIAARALRVAPPVRELTRASR